MDKIVIVTNQSEPDYGLIELINMVFPDCEVRVAFSETEAPEEVTTGPQLSIQRWKEQRQSS